MEVTPVYLADQPKRPLRIPVWLEKEEQARLEATIKSRENIPINIFGHHQERRTETRRRYELLFGLLLNSGSARDTCKKLSHSSPARSA